MFVSFVHAVDSAAVDLFGVKLLRQNATPLIQIRRINASTTEQKGKGKNASIADIWLILSVQILYGL